MEEEGGNEATRKRRRKEEEVQNEIIARRLAITNMKATEWDFKTHGFGVEICGDSLLIISWLLGRWAITDYTYRKRIGYIIDIMSSLTEIYGVRAPSNGRDPFKHEFREVNEHADRLTHDAREGRSHEWKRSFCMTHTHGHITPIALRGSFDGGKSEDGVGCGAWLEAAFISRSDRIEGKFSTVSWQLVWEKAWLIPSESTVTQAELSAAECTVHNIVRLLGEFESYFT
jgi:hypothetical protein